MFLISYDSDRYPIETASLNDYSIWVRAYETNHDNTIPKLTVKCVKPLIGHWEAPVSSDFPETIYGD